VIVKSKTKVKKMRNEPSKKAKFTPCSLHNAISSQMGISSEIVQEILETTPKAAELVDREGKLPLHIAYINYATNNIVNMLIHHYPAAAEVKDNDGNLPFHYACRENSCWDPIKEALELYPKAI
jgi:ankyrin repeat protein